MPPDARRVPVLQLQPRENELVSGRQPAGQRLGHNPLHVNMNTETDAATTAEPAHSEPPPPAEPAAPLVDPQDDPARVTAWLATVFAVVSAVMVMWHLQDSSLDNANTGSRYATIEALVDQGTFHIEKTHYRNTIDKLQVDKHYISSKPPTLPTYAAGVYWVYKQITGHTIGNHEGQVVWLVSLFTGWLAHVIFLIYLYLFCRLLLKRQLAILLTVAAGSFAYLGVAYATAINNHSIAASVGLVGLYYAFRVRNGHSQGPRHWIFAGLCFGLLPAIDLPSLSLSFFVGLYLLSHDWRRTLLFFVPALLPGFIAQLALGYVITGSLVPAYSNSELKSYAGNYFRQVKTGIDALREPKHIYGFNVLLGHHGLFSMTPLFLFSLWEMVRDWRRRDRYLPELVLITTTVLIVLSFYIFKTRNYGGWCVGMRWLVPIMPLLLLYFGLWLDRVRLTRVTWAAVLVAFGISAFHVQDGLTSPFQFSVWHNWLEGQPNRNRIGPKMNLPKKKAKKSKRSRARN